MRKISLGIMGTSKNTGKTTALTAIINGLTDAGASQLGITGIGYDGESFDNVTGLPKPRIYVRDGMLAAIAERCADTSGAVLERLIKTDIETPLGKIIICRVKSSGRLVVAGPVKRSGLSKTLSYLFEYGARFNIIDGALGRMTPFTEADGIIIATGASRNTDISALALESGRMIELLNCGVLSEKGVARRFGSVLTEDGLRKFLGLLETSDTIVIDGIICGRFLRDIAGMDGLSGKRLLFSDPIKLLLSGEVNGSYDAITELRRVLEIGVQKSVNVISVAVNPYYPKYRYTTGDYEPAFVDKDKLLNEITRQTRVRCHDIVAQGADGLLNDVMRFREGI